MDIEEPQDQARVIEWIQSRTAFTAGSDKERVIKMYQKYRSDAFDAMNTRCVNNRFCARGPEWDAGGAPAWP